ncbi:MAG: hypothetical protein NTV45_03335 [Firmicutes bacterium]|nr:hypothetical protein [Bacillota bacterium]
MQDLHRECPVCDACGVCARTEENCGVYHDFFQIGEEQIVKFDLYHEYTQFEVSVVAAPAKKLVVPETLFQSASGM